MAFRSTPELLTLHAVRLLGFADTSRIAARFEQPEPEVEDQLLDAEAYGWVTHTSFAGDGGWSLTEAGKIENERLLGKELDQVRARAIAEQVHTEFLPYNHIVTELCTAWQLAEAGIDGRKVELQEILIGLALTSDEFAGLEAALAAKLDRFSGYHWRYREAHARAADDPVWITATDRDSCHRVWFEFHEDLIATLGLTRG